MIYRVVVGACGGKVRKVGEEGEKRAGQRRGKA